MELRFEFGIIETYMLYVSIVLLAIFFASLSNKKLINKKGKKISLSFLLIVSFFILAIPLIFRKSGVDNLNYLLEYNAILSWNGDLVQNYRGFPEPLFMLLNYLNAITFDNYQLVYISSGVISLIFLYKAFEKKMNELEPGLIIALFCFTLYFYMYGLVRLLIAVSIMTYALKYLETQKLKKYIAWGIIAGLFHYSALVIVPLFVLVASMSNKNVKEFRFFKGIAIATLVTPTVFLLGINIFQRIFKGFSWFGRYSKYFDLNTISIRVLKNVVWILPLLLILILYGRYLEKRMSSFKLHANLVLVMMSIAVISVVFGVQRLIYYIYPSAFYLYSAVLELPFKTGEKKKIKLFFWVGITIMGLVWMLVVIIGGDNWNKFMIPYSIYIK